MKKRVVHGLCFAVALLFSVTAMFPFLFVVVNAFVPGEALFANYGPLLTGAGRMKMEWLPVSVSLENYAEVLLLTSDYLVKFWISVALTFGIVAGQIVVSCLAGYGFTKFRFPGRSILLYLIIILMMMPIQVSLVPQYLVLDWMNLLGSYWALIFPGWFAAFGIFLMTQIYQRFPEDILEAAQVDGAGELRKFWNIVLPNSLSGISSLMILSFIDNWNMVEQPLIFLQDYRMYPLSVFLSFINEDNLGIAFACGTLAILPPLILFLFFKDAMVKGIEYASVK